MRWPRARRRGRLGIKNRPQTRVGTFIGTPGYAAPEQVEGRADINARADIYALGALLYVILSGRLPVAGKRALE